MSDFTGGWNLRADAFQLGQNESPDMRDMTVEIGGGFVQRNVVVPFASGPVPATVENFWSYTTPTVTQVVAATSTHLYYSTGGAWTAAATGFNPANKPRAAVFNNNLYLVSGSSASARWTGTTLTALGTAWNETIGGENPTEGNMPSARYICSHMGRVFIAYTTESGTDHPCRIRWSHVNAPESWRQEDFIDIDLGKNGDVITGIVEFNQRLYIYKNNSISILTGYSTANFAVTTISEDIGAVSQEAIQVSDVGLFTFSWPQGVYLDRTGTGPYPIFDKLFPLTRDGFIDSVYRDQISMGWINQMLWCSIPYESPTNSLVLVYNPWIYKNRYLRFLQGPWYPYSLAINNYVTQFQPGGPTLYLASQAGTGNIGQLEQQGSVDNWAGTPTPINSYFKTRWVDLGSPSVVKRWRHPDVAMRTPGDETVTVEVCRDYDNSAVYKTFTLSPPPLQRGMVWSGGASPWIEIGGGTYLSSPAISSVTKTPDDTVAGEPLSTDYYVVTAVNANGETPPGLVASVKRSLSRQLSLSPNYYDTVTWGAVSGATSYNVYTQDGATMVLVGNTTSTTMNVYGNLYQPRTTSKTPPIVNTAASSAPGSTTYTYVVTTVFGGVESAPVTVSTSVGPATLSTTNTVIVAWDEVEGAESYNVYGRTAGSMGLMFSYTANPATDQGVGGFSDNGLVTPNLAVPPPSALNQINQGVWDDGTGTVGGRWADLSVNTEAIVRGGSMGSARAVQLKFIGPPGEFWGCDMVSFKYIPKRVRG